MVKLQLITIWTKKHQAGARIFPHRHFYYELVYYRIGRGITSVGDEVLSFAAGTFAVIPAGTEHDEVHREDADLICLGVAGEFPVRPGIYQDREGAVLAILRTLLRETAEQQRGYRDMIAAKLLELKTVTARCGVPGSGGSKDFAFVVSYIAENYHERIVFAELARQLHLSYDYFQHRFHQVTGHSPRQFLLARRLAAARELLEQGQLNCTEIAERCGFSNSAQFSMLFKKDCGQTPLQYRRNKNADQK